jgi:8-oxo-dGTP pyrophosphatase MutT (NUDIX family)
MKPATLKTQTSSGGVIFRNSGDGPEVALVAVKGGNVWCLPKGLVDRGESFEDTAVREVEEETGLRGRLLKRVGQISYWYYIKGENAKCKKTVHFYLLEYVGGRTEDHDWEVERAEWFPIAEAVGKLSYAGDREILSKAKKLISAIADGTSG